MNASLVRPLRNRIVLLNQSNRDAKRERARNESRARRRLNDTIKRHAGTISGGFAISGVLNTT